MPRTGHVRGTRFTTLAATRFLFATSRKWLWAVLAAAPIVAAPRLASAQQDGLESFDCGYRSHEQVVAEMRAAIDAGLIEDPRLREWPEVKSREDSGAARVSGASAPTVVPSDIFPFEDTQRLLTRPSPTFSNFELWALMAAASNAVIEQQGDNFDFIAFFLNFVPARRIGGAFYNGLVNDVTGIGLSPFNERQQMGVAGNRAQGWIMMWDFQGRWGTNPFTMLVLGQEFEHRFAMFLNGLPGRPLQGGGGQGSPGNCGRQAHWNWRVDGQGSGMEIREWVGQDPAVLSRCFGGRGNLCFNTDVGTSPTGLGGVFSYIDLYLMGFVSDFEMDAGSSELRYMDNSDCSGSYSGTISTFSSADIIASNGERSPNSMESQKDFTTAWIMLHQPDAPPTQGQLDSVVDILNMWTETWEWSTLGRSTMDNTLQRSIAFSIPGGVPDTVVPGETIQVDVRIVGASDVLVPDSPTVHYRYDGGDFQSAMMAEVGTNLYRAALPAVACGDAPEYYFSAAGEVVGTVTHPSAAPDDTFSTLVGVLNSAFFVDNFELDRGWTVSGDATDGVWERGVPINSSEGDPRMDFDRSGQCYVTGNTPGSEVAGGSIGTVLTSPPFTVFEGDRIFYGYWLNGTAEMTLPGAFDPMTVEVATDRDGTNWQLVRSYATRSSGWRTEDLVVGRDFLASRALRIRFTASDLGAPAVIEAGIDDFRIRALRCGDEGFQCAIFGVVDADGDEVCDDIDNCLGLSNPGQADADQDGIGDVCDDCNDTDGDGYGDGSGGNLGCPNGTAIDCDDSIGNTSDSDGDNVCEPNDDCPGTARGDPVDGRGCSTVDDDGDGVLNDQDLCPDTPDCASPVSGDGCPGDADSDDVVDGCDNCLVAFNPRQTDADGNGLGDACDSLLAFTSCPGDLAIPTVSAAGLVVSYQMPQAQNGFGQVTIVADPPAGSLFPVGSTVVTVAATDDAAKTVLCSFRVTVTLLSTAPGQSPPQDQGCGCGVGGAMLAPMSLAFIGFMWRRRAPRRRPASSK